ncbi:MAG: tRNA (adenosine(37)-N6)-threonylcarbamoyltransferase complex dimerization subunit type 1 TsaB [Phenylobacterium sp.]|nr:tRNA (adenosine(37)-N6)-threonylcarbamoyltransferase complex dimerization subunit type 1 TsaB [Phenylobacterium sp.]MDO8899729.1 tRNA (adenosine(37)-N6)-threonylcarbamoyltransferase complex dimerization subunit type 1 TsaB [Phenylobacterium sp.]MDP2213328.1 tRNA (adenosine(37)-N6)-threonylcarbamoyltransferase complex dimerization subunit type 1 TsaB [Phenylobacterium sp.]
MTLGLDTCLDACSAAILHDGVVRGQMSHPMGRGHQEAIAPLVKALMDEAGLVFPDLDRIGVTIGPGSFTGLRVGLAFAKGLGAALGRPVVGVGTLAALAEPLGDALVFALIDARRGQVYLQAFAAGRALMAPDALDVATAAARVAELSGGRDSVLVGSGGPLLADLMPGARLVAAPACDPAAVARLAAAQASPPAPRPLYLRAPDARLPGGAPGPDMA